MFQLRRKQTLRLGPAIASAGRVPYRFIQSHADGGGVCCLSGWENKHGVLLRENSSGQSVSARRRLQTPHLSPLAKLIQSVVCRRAVVVVDNVTIRR